MFYLGPYRYESKEELKERLKSFLSSANDGPITHRVAVDKLQYLLYMHPRAHEKIGPGIKQFMVASNHLGSGKGFMLIRTDGKSERFSYRKCIDGEFATHRSRVVEAFRFAVRDQRNRFRESLTFPVECALSNRLIHNRTELHIDHKVPFWRLLEDFRLLEGFDLENLCTHGNGEQLELADSSLAIRWQQYHERTAQLQPTYKGANQVKGARYSLSEQAL